MNNDPDARVLPGNLAQPLCLATVEAREAVYASLAVTNSSLIPFSRDTSLQLTCLAGSLPC
jgi:hypothetical protein